jgi:hypothetical protein
MIKAALLFLVVIMALALFGRFRVGRSRGNRPGSGSGSGSGSAPKLPAQRCKSCGRFLFDRAPCPCGGKARS